MNGARFWIIGDENAVLGFALLGVAGEIVHTPDEASQALKNAVARGEHGIVMVTADWAAVLCEEIDRLKSSMAGPLILEIPASSAQIGQPSLRAALQRALGIRLHTYAA